MNTQAPPPVGQLRWRTRRGLRELDLILRRYLEQRYPSAPQSQQRAFAELLDEADGDLLDWLLGRRPPPERFADVLGALGADR